MLSTPSYFKLKSQLRLAAEYDPSTCTEFELRCNSATSNLRYRTVLATSGYVYMSVYVRKCTLALTPQCHRVRETRHRIQPLSQYSTNQRSERSSPARSPFARRALGYKPHHRGKRNRRVQPPRLPARVPPVRRSVDVQRNPTNRRRPTAPRLP